jgi:hypothetical protein
MTGAIFRIPHAWCNYQNPFRPVSEQNHVNCEMCKGLYRDYPPRTDDGPDDLRKRYFPNVKVVDR